MSARNFYYKCFLGGSIFTLILIAGESVILAHAVSTGSWDLYLSKYEIKLSGASAKVAHLGILGFLGLSFAFTLDSYRKWRI
ncbi:hypothetical protein [Microbulbifer sp. Q7]|uniref:hypothetical protein n=1 Tax=Microbulbifer sp. Q7 TaxID=1785091 RepID=UPI00129034E0|nr:hypothetical protein [Microbulbifer sp. Q7]